MMKLKRLIPVTLLSVLAVGVVFVAGCSMFRMPDTESKADQIEGQWTVPYYYEGVCYDAIVSVEHGGVAYWMEVANTETLQLTSFVADKWKRTGTYTYDFIKHKDGITYHLTYDKESDTLSDEGSGYVLKRLDPLVGIWSGVYTDTDGIDCNLTCHIKDNGKGTMYYAKDDGWSYIAYVNWVKNLDGTFSFKDTKGTSVKFSVDEEEETAISENGTVMTKCFTDSVYIVPVTGIWYCEEYNLVMRWNADMTGSLIFTETIPEFNWGFTDTILQYSLQYTTSGAYSGQYTHVSDTKSVTYDPDTDTVSSSSGLVYKRVTETIPELVEVYN